MPLTPVYIPVNHPQRHWSVLVFFISLIEASLLYLRIWIIYLPTYPKMFLRSNTFITYQNYEQFHGYSIAAACVLAAIFGFFLWAIFPSAQIIRITLFRWIISAFSFVLLLFNLVLCAGSLMFFPPDGFQVITTFDQYEVGLTQRYTYDPFADSSLDITIIRNDGATYWKQLKYVMEPRDNTRTVCETLSTDQREGKIYFLCDDESITSRTPYLNTQDRTIYFGWGTGNKERNLDLLPFDGNR
jgi:hypothetical protein